VESEEIWKDCAGWEGKYQVSTLGNVKSLDRYTRRVDGTINHCREKPRKTQISNCGYVRVSFFDEGKNFMLSVHRLVAEAFIPNPENKPEVNHISGIKTDNSVQNLEWMSSRENKKHGIEMGLISHNGINNNNCKLQEYRIRIIKKLKGIITQKKLATYFGVAENHIGLIHRGKSWKHITI
jgi:hypothetical protein